ncbi:sigma-70 family RNA polymerase sigma factor [Solirubrobacter soli]|uniref:sigma-70 family RNA polymerase sigma factor n=1 Tax=Solirubrobacter soli TaxID=363832 RepID=UPI00069D5246|nr:sigma-70 family RNA polymerase sigma factor [Solirubrobacter soli]
MTDTAYLELVEPFRRELHAHCYRMLGSVEDAEDALQDALLRAWRGLARFEGRSSVRTWLYKVATNASLDVAARRASRALPTDHVGPAEVHAVPGRPLEESVWIEPYPHEEPEGLAGPEARYERRESVELAFVAATQFLPPRQRAVLLLRDVLGFSAREVADVLDMSVASANSALGRARRTLESRLPQESQQTAARGLGDTRLRALVERLVDAMERSDVDAVVAELTADATWSMPPDSTWYRGEALRAFLVEWPLTNQWRHLPARANGQTAIGSYMWEPAAGLFLPEALDVYTIRGDRIAAVTAFKTKGIFPRFGLPEEIRE